MCLDLRLRGKSWGTSPFYIWQNKQLLPLCEGNRTLCLPLIGYTTRQVTPTQGQRFYYIYPTKSSVHMNEHFSTAHSFNALSYQVPYFTIWAATRENLTLFLYDQPVHHRLQTQCSLFFVAKFPLIARDRNRYEGLDGGLVFTIH